MASYRKNAEFPANPGFYLDAVVNIREEQAAQGKKDTCVSWRLRSFYYIPA